MKFLSRQESREVDRIAIEKFGFSGLVLMENAGRGVVETLERFRVVRHDEPIGIVCGKGNNGGDGFVIARHLRLRGYRPRVVMLAGPDELSGDAKTNFNILRLHGDVDIYSFRAISESNRNEFDKLLQCPVLIDAMLGTGATGPPREPFAEAIRAMNDIRKARSARTVAVDIPSGLDADSGEPNDPTIIADFTLTFYSEKIGFTEPSAIPYTGTVIVQDIGVIST